jgi:putative Mg2+ transporter-C (MgtC) family protein
MCIFKKRRNKNHIYAEELVKLLIALFAGAIIGAEREYKSKAAGFRTVILITVGSTLFTMISNYISNDGRVASNIVTGIGFLGAGAIFREGMNVKGLTTATTIWISAAIGMAIGIGRYEFAFAALIIVMMVLLSFTWIQMLIERSNKIETYNITFVHSDEFDLEDLLILIKNFDLTVSISKKTKNQNMHSCVFSIQGRAKNHENLVKELFSSKFILGFDV